MDAKKALVITWVILGLLIAGAIGFYLGRSNLGRGLNQLNNVQGPGQGSGAANQPTGGPPTGTPIPFSQ